MALNYDQPIPTSDVVAALAANGYISTATLAAIEDLLNTDTSSSLSVAVITVGEDGALEITLPEGSSTAQAAFFNTLTGQTLDFNSASTGGGVFADTPVYVFTGNGNVNAVFNTVDRVIIGGEGNDSLVVLGDHNTTVDGGAGNDTIVTSGGNDSVSGGAGDDVVSTGSGNDTILTSSGNDTIDAGANFDVIQLGLVSNYVLTDGELLVERDGAWVATRTDGTESIVRNAEQFIFTGEPGQEDTVISFAETHEDAVALYLYEALLDRAADSEGADFWLDQLDHDNVSLTDIANGFLASSEFSTLNGSNINNDDFVDLLYENLLGREARLDSEGKAFWFDQLEAGADRAELVVNFVELAMANPVDETGIAQIIILGDDEQAS